MRETQEVPGEGWVLSSATLGAEDAQTLLADGFVRLSLHQVDAIH